LFYGINEVAHFNAYNKPKLEAKKYGSTLALRLWVPYETIRGIKYASLQNGVFGLKVIWFHFFNLPKTQAKGFRMVMGVIWASLNKISTIRINATIWLKG
jgi:hypothetical protein